MTLEQSRKGAGSYSNRRDNWEPDVGGYVVLWVLDIKKTLKRFDKGFKLYGYKALTIEQYNDYFDVN